MRFSERQPYKFMQIYRPYYVLALTMICLCIGMQALGAPITLWNPQTDGDTFTASVLEGFSIPPALSIVIRPQSSPLQDFSPYRLQSAPLIDSLFRPPAIS